MGRDLGVLGKDQGDYASSVPKRVLEQRPRGGAVFMLKSEVKSEKQSTIDIGTQLPIF